jgi:hypothetical protein
VASNQTPKQLPRATIIAAVATIALSYLPLRIIAAFVPVAFALPYWLQLWGAFVLPSYVCAFAAFYFFVTEAKGPAAIAAILTAVLVAAVPWTSAMAFFRVSPDKLNTVWIPSVFFAISVFIVARRASRLASERRPGPFVVNAIVGAGIGMVLMYLFFFIPALFS